MKCNHSWHDTGEDRNEAPWCPQCGERRDGRPSLVQAPPALLMAVPACLRQYSDQSSAILQVRITSITDDGYEWVTESGTAGRISHATAPNWYVWEQRTVELRNIEHGCYCTLGEMLVRRVSFNGKMVMDTEQGCSAIPVLFDVGEVRLIPGNTDVEEHPGYFQ